MFLYDFLKSNVDFIKLTSNQREIIIECPYCGDSERENHGHFYISTTEPHPCMCHLCNFRSGYISLKILNQLKVHHTGESRTYMNEIEKNARFDTSIKKHVKSDGFSKFDLNYFGQDLNKFGYKLDYFSKRTGIILDDENFKKYKLIVDLEAIFELNNLYGNHDINNQDIKRHIRNLQKFYLGFLSFDNSHIIFRKIDDSFKGYRYYNFNVFNQYLDDMKNYYVISNKVDIMQPKIELVLTEGVFDIINLFHYFYNQQDNIIFISNSGKYYLRAIRDIFKLGFLSTDISIYSDSDVQESYYRYAIKPKIFSNTLRVFYNANGKDFGENVDSIHIIERRF